MPTSSMPVTAGPGSRAASAAAGAAPALFLLSLVVALAYNVLVVGPRARPLGDAVEYDLLGRLLAAGEGFVGTKRTPVFPAFLGAIYGLTGDNRFVARVGLCVITAALTVLIHRLTRRLAGDRAALLAGIMAALYQPLFYWSARLNTEMPYTTLLTAAMLALVHAAPSGRHAAKRAPLVLAGVLLGLACLTRPAGVFVLPFVPAWAILADRPLRAGPALRRTLIVLGAAVLVVAPWTLRNYRLTGHVIPLSTLAGNVLIGSNNPVVAAAPLGLRGVAGSQRGGWVPPEDTGLLTPGDFGLLMRASEYESDQLYRRRAFEWMRSEPGAVIRLAVHKVLRLLDFVPPERGLRGWLVLLPYYGVLALAVLGAWITRREWRRYLPVHLMIVSTVAGAMITWGGRRFRHPLEPALVLLAAVALSELAARAPRRRGALLAGLVAAALLPAGAGSAAWPAEAGRDSLHGFEAHVFRRANGDELRYRLFVPPAARGGEEAGRLPLIVYLHGANGAGEDNTRQLEGGNARGTRGWTRPALLRAHPAFVLAPQIPAGERWGIDDPEALSVHESMILALIDDLASRHAIDAGRVYLVGQSLGGAGAWDLASKRPRRFAAVVTMGGYGPPRAADGLARLPVWIFHGALDESVPVAMARRMVDAIRAAGGTPRYTEYADLGHTVWERAYEEPGLVNWLFAQRRTR